MGRTLARIGLTAGLLAQAATTAAQTTPQNPLGDKTIVVEGRRMPPAEAPRSATCIAMLQDPLFRRQMMEASGTYGIFMPTRLPRNPDYAAAPRVPAGSPLPELSKNRFGVTDRFYMATPGTGMVETSDQIATGESALGGDPSGTNETSQEAAIASCRSRYTSASGVNAPQIAENDRTLPMGFALFEQGRYAEALPWFEKAATKLSQRDGGDEAMLFVGKLKLQGLGAGSDPAGGIKWLKRAAGLPFDPNKDIPLFDPRNPDRNTAVGEAAVILANIYRTGFAGVPKDMKEACRYYDRAFDAGHVMAAKTLGDIYWKGDGVPRDAKKAVGYYRKAAELDLPMAQVALADILSAGDDGIPADPAQAVKLYTSAAKHDDGRALYMVARAYDDGRGVRADPARALSLYKTAALVGYPAAKVALGIYFHEGRQLPRDDAMARKWFEEAARDRDVDGMFNLAALYASGSGGPRDLAQAWVWLKRAAALGHTDAPAAMRQIEARMTPADKAAANERLRA